MRQSLTVGRGGIGKIDKGAIATAHDKNMAGYSYNNRKTLVGYVYQILQSAKRVGIGFKAKIIRNVRQSRLTSHETTRCIPHAHIRFHTEHVCPDVIVP